MVKELVRETDEVRAKRDKAVSRKGDRRVINVDDRKNSTIITPTLNKTHDSNQVMVNNYRVMGKLGSGSYGTVHLVELVPSCAKFAMKIVSKNKLRKKKLGQSDEQLLREVRPGRGVWVCWAWGVLGVGVLGVGIGGGAVVRCVWACQCAAEVIGCDEWLIVGWCLEDDY